MKHKKADIISITRNTAITCIFTLIKMGVDDRKIFRNFLKAHGLYPKTETTLSDYIRVARSKIGKDFDNTAWLTEKIQTAHLKDFREIWEITDKFIQQDLELLEYVYTKARIRAKNIRGDEKYFPEFLEYETIGNIMSKGIQAMAFKRELMEKGFFVYRFKRYTDTLQAKISGEITEEQTKQELKNDPMLESMKITNKEDHDSYYKDPKQEFQLADHLKGLEKRIGKKLSDLE